MISTTKKQRYVKMPPNRGYDPKQFIASKIIKTVIFLPGIGRFCKCGCNEHVSGRKDKLFFSSQCRRKYYDIEKGRKPSKYHLDARIHLISKEQDFHLLVIYFNNGKKFEYKIRPKTNVFAILEKISKYRQSDPLLQIKQGQKLEILK